MFSKEETKNSAKLAGIISLCVVSYFIGYCSGYHRALSDNIYREPQRLNPQEAQPSTQPATQPSENPRKIESKLPNLLKEEIGN